MQGIKNFFQRVWQSVYSPRFYAGLVQKSLSRAFGYFFLLTFLLALIQAVVPIVLFVTIGTKAIDSALMQAKNVYPSDLQLSVKNGIVTTNVKEPYFIYWPGNPQRVVVIDTKTPFSMEQFNTYHAAVWISKDAVFVSSGQDGQIKTIDLSQTNDLTLNKSLITAFFVKAMPIVHIVEVFVPFIIVIGLYLLYLFRLVYLLFLAVLIWLVGKVMKQAWSYGTSYKIGLYAMTAGFLLDVLLGVSHTHSFGFLFTIVSLLVIVVNVASQKGKKAPHLARSKKAK